MTDAFTTIIDEHEGRIVNVGSGGGPMFVRDLPVDEQTAWYSQTQKWEEIVQRVDAQLKVLDKGFPVYKMSKAAMHC